VTVENRPLDLGDLGSVEACAQAAGVSGGVDILINNTGGPPPSGALGVAPELWLQQFQSMVLAVIRVTDLLVPAMREKKWGRVVTVTSSGVIQPIPTLAVSNTLRASIVTFMKTLSAEVAADGVTVNVMAPGRIWTERTDEIDAANAKRTGASQEQVRQQSMTTIPVGRYGKVEEFAAVACFLASARASYVTGQVMRVDGGMIRSV
jgi:3-oxoacyl-[acyl-carrier protein] reductase